MPKVYYLGPEHLFTHRGPAPGGPYVFVEGQGTPVNMEAAKFYENEEKDGNPWRVEYSSTEKVKKKIKKR